MPKACDVPTGTINTIQATELRSVVLVALRAYHLSKVRITILVN